MIVLYHQPSLDSIYAQRTIYYGYKHAFESLGHTFIVFTARDNLLEILEKYPVDIFMTSSHFYYRKFIDYKLLKKYRQNGLVVFTKIDFWSSPMGKTRINEARSLKNDSQTLKLIRDGLLGDVFHHVVEQEDERMYGFEKGTDHKYFTLPLACDDTLVDKVESSSKFKSDISFVGTYLPSKREFFRTQVLPLNKHYDLRIWGQDWTRRDRLKGLIQKTGQYFNNSYLGSIQKPTLKLEEELSIYKSSTISINVHELYQREFGGDCNERTFKIPLSDGFEITDKVSCVSKYFIPGQEMIIAENKSDWLEKIEYYLANPHERLSIIKAGKERVLKEHTYKERVKTIQNLYFQFKNRSI